MSSSKIIKLHQTIIGFVACQKNLEAAYQWLCQQRKDYSHNSDVWNLRRDWEAEKPLIQAELLNGTYRFSPLQQYRFNDETPDDIKDVWTAKDALVLKAMAIVLNNSSAADDKKATRKTRMVFSRNVSEMIAIFFNWL